MTTVFVDLVNLDGSRPEGTLRFSLERLVLGDPDVVPSAVEVKIRDGRARVEGLLPGAMRVRVGAGCWSKDWEVSIPESGEHDLFDLLEWQAPEFEETVWAALAKRVEALENTPAVDLAPLEKRVGELESKPDPVPVDLAPLEDATRNLDNRVTALEGKPEPTPFDPTELKTQLAELRAHLTPVNLTSGDDISADLAPVYNTSGLASAWQQAGRVDIGFNAWNVEAFIRALDGLQLPHFPEASEFPDDGESNCQVELYQGAKFLTKLDPIKISLNNWSGPLQFHVALDDVLAVVKETGANRVILSTFYYTNELPPETTE